MYLKVTPYLHQLPADHQHPKNVVVVSADAQSLLLSETASAAYYSEAGGSLIWETCPWPSTSLFDLDFPETGWQNMETKTRNPDCCSILTKC